MDGMPQGLKPLFVLSEREAKAEALGYLEATATATTMATADPYGMTTRKTKATATTDPLRG